MAVTEYTLVSLTDSNNSTILDKDVMLKTFRERLDHYKLDSMNHYERVLKYCILLEMALEELGYHITAKTHDE